MDKPVICIGGALIDELFYANETMMLRTTNMVTAKKSAGGVSRNLAHQLALLNVPVEFIGVFGNDADGDWLKSICIKAGININASITADVGTGKYTGIINPDGSLFTALFSNAAEYLITPEYLEQHQTLLLSAEYLLADTNLTVEAIAWLANFSQQNNIPLIIEPVSVGPAKKLSAINLNRVYLITPNEDELPAMCSQPAFTVKEQVNELLERGVQYIWLHKGEEGSVLYSKTETLVLHAPKINVVDCTGAGDASVSGYIMSKYLGNDDASSLKIAHTLAAEILQVNGAIAEHITQEKLLQSVSKYYQA